MSANAQTINEPETRTADQTILSVENLTVAYSGNPAVRDVSLEFSEHSITAIIGPSGCGKSTLLRCFNRMNDFIPELTIDGKVMYRSNDLFDAHVDPVEVRRRIGMVFQKPNPFPKSIHNNIAWGPKLNGYSGDLEELVQRSLEQAALWDEVKDKLGQSGLALSGGQQQRLCIARALAMNPEVILLDEPCSALDPASTAKIEELLVKLRSTYTFIIVTHNMQQAARVSDHTAFLCEGRLVEYGLTEKIFTKPDKKETEEYVTGKFG